MRTWLGCDEGSSTTELVLLMPAVLLAVLVSVQVALFFHARQVVEAAAQEGLEAAQAEAATADVGRVEAESFLGDAGGIREAVVAVTRTASEVVVQVRGAAPNVLPFSVWTVEASATGPVERFIAEPDR